MTVIAASTAVWVFILIPLVIVWALAIVDIVRRPLSRAQTAAWILVVVLLPLAILAFARWTASRLGYRTPPLPKWRPWMSVVTGVIVLSFLIVRNLPGFEYLRATAS